jgi:hypothetical protein
VRRVFSVVVIAGLAGAPFASHAGQFCTHARVVMRHSCCPPTSDPEAPRLLCCTPVGHERATEAVTLSGEGVQLALAAAPVQGLQTPAWQPLTLAARPCAAPNLASQGPPLPLRV